MLGQHRLPAQRRRASRRATSAACSCILAALRGSATSAAWRASASSAQVRLQARHLSGILLHDGCPARLHGASQRAVIHAAQRRAGEGRGGERRGGLSRGLGAGCCACPALQDGPSGSTALPYWHRREIIPVGAHAQASTARPSPSCSRSPGTERTSTRTTVRPAGPNPHPLYTHPRTTSTHPHAHLKGSASTSTAVMCSQRVSGSPLMCCQISSSTSPAGTASWPAVAILHSHQR